jgi:16S rRNA (cytidine1402-2'-O)-methyltransferase
MLYLVATPIGNLGDITFRAVETLKRCAYILCEDTRHSHFLLQHYGIQTPLKSFHKFNEASREETILDDLKKGLHIALISDAGMPAICDPGSRLVAACREHQLATTIIPGPCAFISALALSGWECNCFQFIGFLPKSKGSLESQLQQLAHYEGISIAYETPKRLLKTLSVLAILQPTLQIAIARELTKIHEELQTGTPEMLLSHYSVHPPKGEIVLLIQGRKESQKFISNEELLEQIQQTIENQKVPLSQAIRLVAQETGMSRNKLYEMTHLALEIDDC